MGSVLTVERIRRSLLLMIGFPSWIVYLYVFGFGFLVLCILKVSRAAGSLHRAVGPMHAPCPGAGCGLSHCGGFASMTRGTMGSCLVDGVHLYMCNLCM